MTPLPFLPASMTAHGEGASLTASSDKVCTSSPLGWWGDAWALATDEVHVWVVHLDVSRAPADATRDLDAVELARAARIRRPLEQARFVAAHAALRTVLSRYVSLPPSAVGFTIERGGKPRLRHDPVRTNCHAPDVRFSLTHSDAVAAVAVSLGSEIGADVERERALPDWPAVAERVCSPEERRVLALANDPAEVARVFSQMWVRKEAFVKATGDGLAMDLSAVGVLPLDAPSATVSVTADGRRGGAAQSWHVHDFIVHRGYRGAIASPISRPAVIVRHLHA